MKNLNFLIKPSSSLCNMRCRYCFYEDEASIRTQRSMGLMGRDTGELLIREAMAAVEPGGQLQFTFQGGEPTLVGLDFFRWFVDTARQQNTKKIRVSYAIQTNGLELDGQWAEFFRQEGFLVGVSLDGDKALHDEFRPAADGKGTWIRVSRNVALLQKAGVDVNLLCVVTKRCAKAPQRVYHALKKTGVKYLQFIPCLDPMEAPRGSMPWSLTPEDYGGFLCGVFDEWYRDWRSGQYVSVRLFDDYVHLAMGLPAGTCATSGHCGAYFVVEADGGLYPCDFYVLDQWKLGNLGDAPLEELGRGQVAQRFLREGEQRPSACAACQWQPLCFGGCKRDWMRTADRGELVNYYCPAFQRFFAYGAERIRQIALAEYRARRR